MHCAWQRGERVETCYWARFKKKCRRKCWLLRIFRFPKSSTNTHSYSVRHHSFIGSDDLDFIAAPGEIQFQFWVSSTFTMFVFVLEFQQITATHKNKLHFCSDNSQFHTNFCISLSLVCSIRCVCLSPGANYIVPFLPSNRNDLSLFNNLICRGTIFRFRFHSNPKIIIIEMWVLSIFTLVSAYKCFECCCFFVQRHKKNWRNILVQTKYNLWIDRHAAINIELTWRLAIPQILPILWREKTFFFSLYTKINFSILQSWHIWDVIWHNHSDEGLKMLTQFSLKISVRRLFHSFRKP